MAVLKFHKGEIDESVPLYFLPRYLSVFLPRYLSVFLFIYIYLSNSLSVFYLTIYLYIYYLYFQLAKCVNVTMIDFAHVWEGEGKQDSNYLPGIQHLHRIVTEFSA